LILCNDVPGQRIYIDDRVKWRDFRPEKWKVNRGKTEYSLPLGIQTIIPQEDTNKIGMFLWTWGMRG
jgi:hypothetical protein